MAGFRLTVPLSRAKLRPAALDGLSAREWRDDIMSAEDKTPETEAETPHVAKVGVVDKGHNVTSFNDEPINGLIADLADGDA
jgi:hypothetical protein